LILLRSFYGYSDDPTLLKRHGETGNHGVSGFHHLRPIGPPLNPMEGDNFCLPHASLRVPLPQPVPTNGTGSVKQWRPCTPAMAAGLTDHVWTLREMLQFRVPPWPQPVGL
jgi:hypothetical protein